MAVPHGAVYAPARVRLAKIEQAVENGTVLPQVEPLHLCQVVLLRIGGYFRQEIHVILGVELGHLDGVRFARALCFFFVDWMG